LKYQDEGVLQSRGSLLGLIHYVVSGVNRRLLGQIDLLEVQAKLRSIPYQQQSKVALTS
jgi:hypothetical protein